MNAEYMNGLYECWMRSDKPIVMHIGRELKSTAYNCDPYAVQAPQRLHKRTRMRIMKICPTQAEKLLKISTACAASRP